MTDNRVSFKRIWNDIEPFIRNQDAVPNIQQKISDSTKNPIHCKLTQHNGVLLFFFDMTFLTLTLVIYSVELFVAWFSVPERKMLTLISPHVLRRT